MDLRLLVVQGKPEGKEILIRNAKFLIGRNPECDIRPNSELISRQHCEITQVGEEVRLRDLGSSNGTIVNGERITGEILLNDGDLLQVGPLGFQVVLQRSAAPVETPQPVAMAAAVASPEAPSDPTVDSDVSQWLVGDSKSGVPDSGSQVFGGDTQIAPKASLTDTPVPELPTVQMSKESLEQPTTQSAEPDSEGPKSKNTGPKNKIEKTRDDTSRAAADIIRRMMGRRPQ
jgi:pSer/pThr/pTyr-binding forkhead associated (FHA) protein